MDTETKNHCEPLASGEGYYQVTQEKSNEKKEGLEHEHDHHHAARRVIKHLASQIDEPNELDIDDRRLARTVRDAGEYSYGVIACEVWALEVRRKFVHCRAFEFNDLI